MDKNEKPHSKLFPDLSDPVKQEPKLGIKKQLLLKIKGINKIIAIAVIMTVVNIIISGSIKSETRLYDEMHQDNLKATRIIENKIEAIEDRNKRQEEMNAEKAEREKLAEMTPDEREALKAKKSFESERTMSFLQGKGLLYRAEASEHRLVDREVIITKAISGEPDRYLDKGMIYLILAIEVKNMDAALIRVYESDFELVVNKLVVKRDVVFNEPGHLKSSTDILPEGILVGSIRFPIDSSYTGTVPVWYEGIEVATIIIDGYGRN